MPSLSMHHLCTATANQMLGALANCLAKAQAHCEAKKIDPNALLLARLYPDMFTLTRQVQVACDTAKGAAARLAGVEIPKHEDTEASFAELRARIEKTLAFVNGLPASAFEGAETRKITLQMRSGPVEFVGLSYLAGFALPNFYFHVTTAYDILRHNGVEVGKRDYLGPA
jgi:uncharacterized protein